MGGKSSIRKKIHILLIILIVFCMFILLNKFSLNYVENNQKIIKTLKKENNINNTYSKIKFSNLEEETVNNTSIENTWSLKIPKINLNANISEGTNQSILNKYIGHFRQTSKWNGNVALAAHNRGYKNNYFEKIDALEFGDTIIYEYKNKTRIYQVEKIEQIKNTDWSNLFNTKNNKLTLITCIKNKPEYRLCVQAIEI